MRRLGRKHIGPRVLGTFLNGRFEQYFEARTLTPKDLRIPETAKQIAKRMRELHDGVDLLEAEREGGPMVFKNWEKWVDRCGQVMNWLDKELQSPQNEVKAASEPWRRRGFVCGVPWEKFRAAVDNYRAWLVESCGGIEEIKQKLVFAHNDVCRCHRSPRKSENMLTCLDPIRQPFAHGACHGVSFTTSCQRAQTARGY